MKNIVLAVMAVFLLSSCAKKEEMPLVISTDVWIGGSPLYYAHAMGWLKEANIEMLQAKSIEENLELFTMQASDMVTGTGHEYQRLKETHPTLVPIIVYDRSYGADVIFSNRTVQQLKASGDTIDVYVERDTVGEDMLDYFCREHQLSRNQMNIYNRDQSEIVKVQNTLSSPPMLVITYHPHDLVLKKQGFKEIANSKSDAYIVVDGIFVTSETLSQHPERLKNLKRLLDRAIEAYHENPHAFYTTVKPYIENPSYEEFELMRSNIRWLNNRNFSALMVTKMQASHFPTDHLIDFKREKE